MAKYGIWTARGLDDYGSPYIEDDDTKIPMSFAFGKIGDSGNMYYDAASMKRYAQIYTDQGIGYIGWYVGRGFSPDDAYHEGWNVGLLAAAHQGCAILDLEPYPAQYWQGISGTPRAFTRGFIDAGGVELHLCPDARNSGINLDEWELCRNEFPQLHIRYLPQAYWTEFRQDMERGIHAAIDPLLNAGIPKEIIWPVLPTYYVDGPIQSPSYHPMLGADLEASIRFVAGLGHPGVSFWRRGFISREAADHILAMDDPFAPPAPPPPPGPQPESEIEHSIQVALAHINAAKISVESALQEVQGK